MLTVFFRSNAKNYELLRQHVGVERKSTAGDWVFVIVLLLTLLVLLALLVWSAFALGKYLYQVIAG